MVQHHLARIAAPRTWPVPRKKTKWIVKPLPGPQKKEHSLPLIIVLRDLFKIADTAHEVKYILNSGAVLVNKKVRKDPRYGVGLMSLVEIVPLKKTAIVIFNKRGKLTLREIPSTDTVLLRIVKRSAVKGRKIQINCHDGRNILSDVKCKSGDSLVFDLSSGKIKEVLPLQKDSKAYIFGGKHMGELASVVGVVNKHDLEHARVTVEVGGKEFTTLKDHLFVVGHYDPLGAK